MTYRHSVFTFITHEYRIQYSSPRSRAPKTAFAEMKSRRLLLVLALALEQLAITKGLQAGCHPSRVCSPRCSTTNLVDASEVVNEASRALQPSFAAVDKKTEAALSRVLDAFRRNGVGSHSFAG